MKIKVLGSAAGGGFPQWNCGCKNCERVRAGEPGWQQRSQDSIAISADGERWWLLNASPDVLQQTQRSRALWPKRLRHSPIAGVVLSNGDLDHVLRSGPSDQVHGDEAGAGQRGEDLHVLARRQHPGLAAVEGAGGTIGLGGYNVHDLLVAQGARLGEWLPSCLSSRLR